MSFFCVLGMLRWGYPVVHHTGSVDFGVVTEFFQLGWSQIPMEYYSHAALIPTMQCRDIPASVRNCGSSTGPSWSCLKSRPSALGKELWWQKKCQGSATKEGMFFLGEQFCISQKDGVTPSRTLGIRELLWDGTNWAVPLPNAWVGALEWFHPRFFTQHLFLCSSMGSPGIFLASGFAPSLGFGCGKVPGDHPSFQHSCPFPST